MPRSSTTPRRRSPRRFGLIGAIALLIAALAGGLQHCQGTAANPPARDGSRTSAGNTSVAVQRQVSTKPPDRYEVLDGQPLTAQDEVRGIWDTLRRIANGPPFPHRQDGVAFQNREARLPKRATGWWREFTVETPGSSDRGARRLVVGSDGELWYSNDHYRTFVRLLPP